MQTVLHFCNWFLWFFQLFLGGCSSSLCILYIPLIKSNLFISMFSAIDETWCYAFVKCAYGSVDIHVHYSAVSVSAGRYLWLLLLFMLHRQTTGIHGKNTYLKKKWWSRKNVDSWLFWYHCDGHRIAFTDLSRLLTLHSILRVQVV